MDPGADDGAALGEHAEGCGDELAGGGEEDRGVELFRRPLVGATRPLRAELTGERLAAGVAGLREGEDPPTLVARDLGDDVRRGAEAVQPESLGVSREPQRAVADQAGAEERRAPASE